MAIDAISSFTSAVTGTASSAPAGGGSVADSFGSALNDLLKSVNTTDSESNQAVSNMIDGTGDVHEAMIAMQRADTMLQLTVQIRNKLVQAYQDIMRMPV